jgi:amidase
LTALTAARLDPETRARQAQRDKADEEDEWGAARTAGLSAGLPEWSTMLARREEYRAAYREFFRDWDVLLAPITLRTAFPHIDMPWPPPDQPSQVFIDIDGRQHVYRDQLVYPGLATLSGQPATAFPVGVSRAGLPMGLQAIGPYLEDMTSIRFAGHASEQMGGFVRPPGY